jgi:hypothetical protein
MARIGRLLLLNTESINSTSQRINNKDKCNTMVKLRVSFRLHISLSRMESQALRLLFFIGITFLYAAIALLTPRRCALPERQPTVQPLKAKSKSHYDWRSVSQYVMVSSPNLGLLTIVFFSSQSYCFVLFGAPSLTRGRVWHVSVFVIEVYSSLSLSAKYLHLNYNLQWTHLQYNKIFTIYTRLVQSRLCTADYALLTSYLVYQAIYRSLYWDRSIQTIRSDPMSLRSIVISTHPRLGLPSELFPYGFHINNIRIPLLANSCYMLCSSHRPWLYHSNYTWQRVQIRSSSLCSILQLPVTSSLLDRTQL